MRLIYVSHPYGGDPANLERARRWYAWLLVEFPANAYVCNWLIEGELLDDGDPVQRRQALARQMEIARRCDAALLVGGEITAGMRDEASTARAVLDLTELGPEPPPANTHGWIANARIGLVAGALSGGFTPC